MNEQEYQQCPMCNKMTLRIRRISKQISRTLPPIIISTECVNENCGIGMITNG
jgi:hypothetical protein